MKKFIYGFITGLIIGALLLYSMPVFAASVKKAITVTYKNIKIVLDGKEIKTDVEPFQYSGRTFVPVRFIAEAFGAEVKWNDNKNTVEISRKHLSQEMEEGEAVINDINDIDIIQGDDNKNYVFFRRINDVIAGKGYAIIYNIELIPNGIGEKLVFTNPTLIKIINGDPYLAIKSPDFNSLKKLNFEWDVILTGIPDNKGLIEYDYYINTILPLIK